jgi:hypothetical protein
MFIMKKTNATIFKNLNANHYVSGEQAREKYIIFNEYHQSALGFDDVSDGFLALQNGHQPHALFYELPLALLLKSEGHGVILLDESGRGKQIDATIDGVPFEMKDMSHTVNYFERLKKNLRETLKKDCSNIVVSIKGEISIEAINIILHRLAHQQETKGIDNMWFSLNGTLYRHKLSDFK